MIFAVDVGNSHVVVGVMDRGAIVYEFRMVSDISRTEDEYAAAISDMLRGNGMSAADIDGAIISSVVPPLTGVLGAVCRTMFGFEALVVGAGVKTGLNLHVDNPTKVGSDLVCAAVAGAQYRLPVILIDMGTATTITAVDAGGSYIGGAIFPGLSLSFNALSNSASLLPKIPLDAPRNTISRNTAEEMRSGAIYGTASMIDGMIARFERELGASATVLATGGLAPAVIPFCEREIEMCPNLIFDGLHLIYERNAKAKAESR
ncbi:MAG: type III pantothenate kinase [Oscillospiraceae bacterium]|jgi:type III pantothenate kinase|nr:type III pantothenate kinase [Oscillospiraceae bacterium]